MSALRRETSVDTAARFLASRQKRSAQYQRPRAVALPRRSRVDRPVANAEPMEPTARVIVNFDRATLEEIHRRLCDCLVDGTETHITRVAEEMVRSALECGEER